VSECHYRLDARGAGVRGREHNPQHPRIATLLEHSSDETDTGKIVFHILADASR
jgi:hypothetical protein